MHGTTRPNTHSHTSALCDCVLSDTALCLSLMRLIPVCTSCVVASLVVSPNKRTLAANPPATPNTHPPPSAHSHTTAFPSDKPTNICKRIFVLCYIIYIPRVVVTQSAAAVAPQFPIQPTKQPTTNQPKNGINAPGITPPTIKWKNNRARNGWCCCCGTV